MATQKQIADSLEFQLRNDTPERFAQVGDGWQQAPMGFFYGNSPHSEISVDLAVRVSMLRVLKADGTMLPQQVWDGLTSLINTNTTAANAVQIMTFADVHATPAA